MRSNQFIFESATDEVYHYTSVHNAADVMQSGLFKLARSTGNKSEEQYAPPGYDYFFSTTRSKVGDYHRFVGGGAVMFVIDGRWLSQRYRVKPIDYWERSWLGVPDRTRESEDRVFSKSPAIPIDCVTEIHVLLKERDEWKSPMARGILLAGKKRGLPTYLYDNEQAWRLQDTRRAIPIEKTVTNIGGKLPTKTMYRPSTNYLEPWVELIYKKSKAELTPAAEKLRYNLVYYGSRYEDEDSGLGNDLSNERKPGSTGYDTASKLVAYMRKSGMKSPLDLKNALCRKWETIK